MKAYSYQEIREWDTDTETKYFGYSKDGLATSEKEWYIERIIGSSLRRAKGAWDDRATLNYV